MSWPNTRSGGGGGGWESQKQRQKHNALCVDAAFLQISVIPGMQVKVPGGYRIPLLRPDKPPEKVQEHQSTAAPQTSPGKKVRAKKAPTHVHFLNLGSRKKSQKERSQVGVGVREGRGETGEIMRKFLTSHLHRCSPAAAAERKGGCKRKESLFHSQWCFWRKEGEDGQSPKSSSVAPPPSVGLRRPPSLAYPSSPETAGIALSEMRFPEKKMQLFKLPFFFPFLLKNKRKSMDFYFACFLLPSFLWEKVAAAVAEQLRLIFQTATRGKVETHG